MPYPDLRLTTPTFGNTDSLFERPNLGNYADRLKIDADLLAPFRPPAAAIPPQQLFSFSFADYERVFGNQIKVFAQLPPEPAAWCVPGGPYYAKPKEGSKYEVFREAKKSSFGTGDLLTIAKAVAKCEPVKKVVDPLVAKGKEEAKRLLWTRRSLWGKVLVVSGGVLLYGTHAALVINNPPSRQHIPLNPGLPSVHQEKGFRYPVDKVQFGITLELNADFSIGGYSVNFW